MRTALFAACLLAVPFAACSKEPTALPPGAHVHADGTVHLPGQPEPGAAKGDHEHGAEHALGEVTLGGLKAQVVLLGDLTPGKEADFDVRFAAGSKRPEVLRAWIGIESGVGSMKKRFENEGDTTMHGHVEVPKVLPEGAKAWFEVETKDGPVRASIAWK